MTCLVAIFAILCSNRDQSEHTNWRDIILNHLYARCRVYAQYDAHTRHFVQQTFSTIQDEDFVFLARIFRKICSFILRHKNVRRGWFSESSCAKAQCQLPQAFMRL